MIHEIEIWKLVLAGIALVGFSFILGFFVAAVCAMSGQADEEIERAMKKHEGGVSQ